MCLKSSDPACLNTFETQSPGEVGMSVGLDTVLTLERCDGEGLVTPFDDSTGTLFEAY